MNRFKWLHRFAANLLRDRRKELLILGIFSVVFVVSTTWSYRLESGTWDEAPHLATGYMSWQGDDRLDPEHPPLLRLWSALPLLAMEIKAPDPVAVNNSWAHMAWCRDFVYRHNDADRLLIAARAMTVLLGLAAGWLLFWWAREWFGLGPAGVVLALYSVEPNILAHTRLVTTDMGVTLLFLGAVYSLWRLLRVVTVWRGVALGVCTGLALAAKFTAVLLGPIILIGLWRGVREPWACSWRGRTWMLTRWRDRALVSIGIWLIVVLASWGTIWATHGFRYLPRTGSSWRFAFDRQPKVRERTPMWAEVVGWVDEHRLLPNAYSQGFLFQRSNAQYRHAYLNGQRSVTGWWYFFPVVFLLKTPVAVLLLILLACCLRGQRGEGLLREGWPVVVTLAVLWVVAMGSRINIGYRHLLPAVPLMLLLAGMAVRYLWRYSFGRRLVWGLVFAAGLEVGMVAPHYLAFNNLLGGGPQNGWRHMADSNLDWGQDLIGLKRWLDQRGIRHVNLSYFGSAPPECYGIKHTPLVGSLQFVPGQQPQLPGYVAVSVTQLLGVHDEQMHRFYRPLAVQSPCARIGYSIHVYWAEQPWWPTP